MNRIYAFFLVAILATTFTGCHSDKSTLTKRQMKEDVRYFFKCFLETHPNPYCKATPNQVDSIKNALISKIDSGLSNEKFSYELEMLNCLLDGHSGIITGIMEPTKKDTMLLPHVVQINSDHSLSLDNTVLSEPNTIISINGILGNKLLDLCSDLTPSDPGILRRNYIERNFPAILTRSGISSPYSIKAHTAKGDTLIKIVGDRPDLFSPQHRSLKVSYQEIGCDLYPKSDVAIIYFNTCQPKDTVLFRRNIDEIFTRIEKAGIKRLFVDISRNNGGNSMWGKYLINKIDQDSSSCYFHEKVTLTKASLNKLRREVDSLMKSDMWEKVPLTTQKEVKKMLKLNLGDYRINTGTISDPAVTNGYSGKVFVLASSGAGSSGSNAIWQFWLKKVGLVLGERSGSSNPMYVYPEVFTLPNSKIGFRISIREAGYVNSAGKYLQEPEPHVPFNIDPFKTSYSEQELLELIKMAEKSHK